jgi:YVTN family beta-propeller protein
MVTDEAIEMMLRERGGTMLPSGLENAIVIAVRAESARRGTLRRWLMRPGFRPALVFALLALLLAAALFAIALGNRNRALPHIDSQVTVGDPVSPRWFTSDGQSLWVHEVAGLVRVDMATSAVTGQVPEYQQYGYATTGAGAVWQSDFDHDALQRIDPVTDTVVKTIPVGGGPEGVAAVDGAVWVADEHDGAVTRVDPATNTVVATIPDIGPQPQIMAAGPDSAWVNAQGMGVVRIDPATNTVGLRVPLDGPVASDGTQVWIGVLAGPNGRPQIVRVDPVSGTTIRAVDLDAEDITYLAVGLGSVWVTADGALFQIDSETGQVVDRLELGEGGDVMVAGGAVWVTSDDQPYVLRIAP